MIKLKTVFWHHQAVVALVALGLGAFISSHEAFAAEVGSNEIRKKIYAKSALVVCATTNQVIFSKRPTDRHLPASTVKLMTGLIAYEKTRMKGRIKVIKRDTYIEPSHVPLIPGEVVNIADMVNALLIGSDNDTGMVIARRVTGDMPSFIKLMNKRAKELGCYNTRYINPHGLPGDGQYTTANDLLVIFRKAISYPALSKILRTKYYSLTTKVGTQKVKNHNKLLWKYKGIGPAKTGWTIKSRHTYAASATRNGREIHLIILNSKSKWADAPILFDYGFANLPPITKRSVAHSTEYFHRHVVKPGDTLYALGRDYGVRVADILVHNHFENPDLIKPGMVVLVPRR